MGRPRGGSAIPGLDPTELRVARRHAGGREWLEREPATPVWSSVASRGRTTVRSILARGLDSSVSGNRSRTNRLPHGPSMDRPTGEAFDNPLVRCHSLKRWPARGVDDANGVDRRVSASRSRNHPLGGRAQLDANDRLWARNPPTAAGPSGSAPDARWTRSDDRRSTGSVGD